LRDVRQAHNPEHTRKDTPIMSAASRLLPVLTMAMVAMMAMMAMTASGCTSLDAISAERAVVERAAIHHDLKRDSGTLFAIAAKRARIGRPELSDRQVVCAISSIDIHFVSETHATYKAAYACGVPPWTLGDGAPVATPTVTLDVLKEQGTWTINGFL
jgi:hypothetical protein